MLAHPFERGDQVEHAGIAGLGEALAARLRQIEMAEDVQAMVDRHDHDIVALRQPRAVVARRVGRAVRERAAMQPDHHRAPRVVETGRPDMQRQAILAHRQGIDRAPHGRELRPLLGGRRLRRAAGIGRRLAHAGPRLGLARRHEAVGAGGRGAVGDALEDMHAVRRDAFDAAGSRLDDGRICWLERSAASACRHHRPWRVLPFLRTGACACQRDGVNVGSCSSGPRASRLAQAHERAWRRAVRKTTTPPSRASRGPWRARR